MTSPDPMTSAAEDRAELLPCPFCGGPCNMLDRTGFYMATCSNCACHLACNYGTRAEAITAWNTRSRPAATGGWEGVAEVMRAELRKSKTIIKHADGVNLYDAIDGDIERLARAAVASLSSQTAGGEGK
jgi:hypothetical protein